MRIARVLMQNHDTIRYEGLEFRQKIRNFQGLPRKRKNPAYPYQFAHTASTPLFLVISPDTTSNRGQMFVRPYGVNICDTLTLRDRWADVDETWHIPRVPGHNF